MVITKEFVIAHLGPMCARDIDKYHRIGASAFFRRVRQLGLDPEAIVNEYTRGAAAADE